MLKQSIWRIFQENRTLNKGKLTISWRRLTKFRNSHGHHVFDSFPWNYCSSSPNLRPRLKHVIFQEIGTLPHITYWQLAMIRRRLTNFFSGHKTLDLLLSKYQDTTCKMKIIVIRKVEKLVYDDFAINLINFFPGDFTKK